MKVPMSSAAMGEAEMAALNEVLCSGTLSMGPKLARFEELVAEHVGVAHAIGVSSGTAALHLSLLAAGIADGDVVVTTPFSFVASTNAILYTGATPAFVDVDPVTGNISVDALRIHLERSSVGARAILPVHIFGVPAPIDEIVKLADDYDLATIEDAAEALGATWKGRAAGAWGAAGIFGFYANKQITTGEGGMVVTDDPAIAETIRALRNQGRDTGDRRLNHARLGYNYRLDELSAAIGAVQMERLDELLDARARVAAWYDERLDAVEGIEVPRADAPDARRSWFVYVVRTTGGVNRDDLKEGLERRSVPSRPYFPPIHLQPYMVERFGYRPGMFPIAEDLGRRSLALPFSSVMEESQVDRVCAALRDAVREIRR